MNGFRGLVLGLVVLALGAPAADAADTTPPVMGPVVSPKGWFQGPDVPASWSATDDDSGVAGYEVQTFWDPKRRDNQWTDVVPPGTSDTSTIYHAFFEQDVIFRVRATDRAGNTSDWVGGPHARVVWPYWDWPFKIASATLSAGRVQVSGSGNDHGVPYRAPLTVRFDGALRGRAVTVVASVPTIRHRNVNGWWDGVDYLDATLTLPGWARGVRVGRVTISAPADLAWFGGEDTMDVSAQSRNAADPLGVGSRAGGNPLAHAPLFVDARYGLANRQQRLWTRQGRIADARLMERIADRPETHRFGFFDSDPYDAVRHYLERADDEAPGTVPMIATYRFPHRSCGGYDDGGDAERARIGTWFDDLADGIADHRAVVFLEIDALITLHCLTPDAQVKRLALLRHATTALAGLPHTVVYLDAAAADAGITPQQMADLLRAAGIDQAQGFFLNATHFDWTNRELAFGDQVSRLLGGKHFVVSTAVNGNGPLVPKDRVHHGNEDRCNPPGRALGTPPTTRTGDARADAFAWIGNAGRSTGPCHPGDPPVGAWFPEYALQLARNAHWRAGSP